MGKIYIDKALKKYIVPTEVRNLSVSSSGTIFTPGTRIPLPKDLKYIRLFTSWGHKLEDSGRVNYDIDLASTFITKDDEIQEVAYYSQSANIAQLSGDVVWCTEWNTKNVSAEFIDIDFQKALKEGYKYAIISQYILSSHDLAFDYDTDVNVYSGVKLLNERIETTEQIDVSDAVFLLKLGGNFQSHMPFAIDFETKEIVMLDFYAEGKRGLNAFINRGNLFTIKRKFFEAVEYSENMYTLFKMYAKANNLEIVKEVEEADVVVSYNDLRTDAKKQEFFNISDNLEKIVGLFS